MSPYRVTRVIPNAPKLRMKGEAQTETGRDGLCKRCEDALGRAGFWVLRVNSGGRRARVRLAPAGTPDLLVDLCHGHMGWLEVKLPRAERNPKQVEWHLAAERRGTLVATVRSEAEALWTVNRWRSEA